MRNREMGLFAKEMRKHQQNEKENLLDHGISVAKNLWKIKNFLSTGKVDNLFLPEVVLRNKQFLLDSL